MDPLLHKLKILLWIAITIMVVFWLLIPFLSNVYKDTKTATSTPVVIDTSATSTLVYEVTGQTGSTTLNLAVADTAAEREQGLSGQPTLAQRHGLLFVFDDASQWGIWMKDMKFAIDILWLDDQWKVIHIEENVAPETYPQVFSPTIPVRYVVELPAGTVDQEEITIGRTIEVSHNSLETSSWLRDLSEKLD
jgi:uncharacterized protein